MSLHICLQSGRKSHGFFSICELEPCEQAQAPMPSCTPGIQTPEFNLSHTGCLPPVCIWCSDLLVTHGLPPSAPMFLQVLKLTAPLHPTLSSCMTLTITELPQPSRPSRHFYPGWVTHGPLWPQLITSLSKGKHAYDQKSKLSKISPGFPFAFTCLSNVQLGVRVITRLHTCNLPCGDHRGLPGQAALAELTGHQF